MKALFSVLFYQPIFNGFVGLYYLIPDVGVAIFVLTVIIKAILYPLTGKSIRAQKSLQDLQPKLEALKKEHKGDQQRLAQETMKLYREHKVNPFGSCLPILIQLPIFIALYYVLRDGLASSNFNLLYSFIPNPGHINTLSLGFIDLQERSVVLALLAGAAQFWQAKSLQRRRPPKPIREGGGKDEDMMAMMNKQMLYGLPVLTVFIGVQFPGGLALYWFLSTLLTGIQQWLLFRQDGSAGAGGAAGGVIEGKVVG